MPNHVTRTPLSALLSAAAALRPALPPSVARKIAANLNALALITPAWTEERRAGGSIPSTSTTAATPPPSTPAFSPPSSAATTAIEDAAAIEALFTSLVAVAETEPARFGRLLRKQEAAPANLSATPCSAEPEISSPVSTTNGDAGMHAVQGGKAKRGRWRKAM